MAVVQTSLCGERSAGFFYVQEISECSCELCYSPIMLSLFSFCFGNIGEEGTLKVNPSTIALWHLYMGLLLYQSDQTPKFVFRLLTPNFNVVGLQFNSYYKVTLEKLFSPLVTSEVEVSST